MAVGEESQRHSARRVAHVVRRYGVASQTFVADAVGELDRLGWEAWVLTRALENRDWFPFPSDERILLGARPPLSRRVLNRALLRSPAERRAERLRPALAAVDPALVHAHFGWAGVDALPAARRLGLPLLVSFHGTDLTVYAHTERGRREYGPLLAGADAVTVVSRFLEGRVRALGYQGTVHIVPAGVRLDEIPFRAPPPAGRVTRLLFVGRHVPVKGLDVLLRALPAVFARRAGLVLDVIGDGPLRARHEALAANLGIAGRVTFHGAQPRARVLAALHDASALVVPSRTPADGAAEGLGRAALEALAAGRPVVATANGGTPETLPPAQRGELVPENDPGALAAAIESLLDRRGEWQRRARVGREWVESEFDNRRLALRTAALYEGLARDLPPSGSHRTMAGRR